MIEMRDSIYYEQLARKARQIAAGHPDPDVARRLRETAVKHDRLARKMAREEKQANAKAKPVRLDFLWQTRKDRQPLDQRPSRSGFP